MSVSGMSRGVHPATGWLTIFFVIAIFNVESPAQGRRESPAIFAVSQNGSDSFLDPVVVVIGGRYTSPTPGERGEAAMSRFADRYYRPGQKYSLFFGGGKSGSVTVKQWLGKSEECNRSMAGISLNTTAKIEGKVMGLATNVDSISRRESSRRMPTQGERASVVKLAQSVFTQKGATAPLLQSLRTINLTAMDLDNDGRFEIVGSFILKKRGGREVRALFLIAEPRGAGYGAGFTRYKVIADKDLPGGASLDDLEDYVLAEILVDQLDLDRDGRGEVVTMDRGFEGVTYRIYKRQRAQWRKVYEYYSYKCAF